MLKISDLSKSFGTKHALCGVSFDIASGEIFSLIGPNGSGKTTLVKIVTGLLQPTSGEVQVDGISVANDPVEAKAKTGYIPDEPTIWPAMTGEEFLHFTGALYGMSQNERLARIPDLLKIFDLTGLEKDSFEDYSRGNKQKFAILAALLHRPKLLIIDEPIVGLDPGSAEVAKREFTTFAKNGGAVLLVTHTLSVAEEIATRVGLLRDGVLVAAGTMEELRARAHLSASASLDKVYRAFTERP